MNSSIVSEQKNGRTPNDIMAGLCRSIIENVFTKVIRVSNLDSLGDRIRCRGGTFANDAVLRALEVYVGRNVVRAPYPGLMGAIGCALIAHDRSTGRKARLLGLTPLTVSRSRRRPTFLVTSARIGVRARWCRFLTVARS